MSYIEEENGQRIVITCEAIFSDHVLLNLAKQFSDRENVQYICFDLMYVEFLHSPSLAELVRTYVFLQKRNIKLQISHVAKINRQVLERTSLNTLFEILDD